MKLTGYAKGLQYGVAELRVIESMLRFPPRLNPVRTAQVAELRDMLGPDVGDAILQQTVWGFQIAPLSLCQKMNPVLTEQVSELRDMLGPVVGL